MSTTYILLYLIIGLVAGLAAGRVIRGRGFGLTGNLVIGIAGALLGGYPGTALKVLGDQGISGAVLAAGLGVITIFGIVAWLKNLACS
ncbi:MAG TPA: hypothetical protein VGJ97_09360 [Anaerolineaceae bacterium]|jgi:uncharacterized membrane protein YeaQ/YmgE (transglycosylase-associated protein family)